MLQLAAALVAWAIFAVWGALALLVYLAIGGGPVPETDSEFLRVAAGLGSFIWLAGAWTTVAWWQMGRTRLWPLPLVLIPGIAFWPLLLLLGWPGVRGAVLPRRADWEAETDVPRILGVPRATFPFALVFWASLIAVWPALLLLVPAVRRAVVPRRSATGPLRF